jgi:hypothetical protein
MRRKTKTITVGFAHTLGKDYYVIEKVTDSVRFHPGDYLNSGQVEDLCVDQNWKVTILRSPKRG